jgi:hypothetical protein
MGSGPSFRGNMQDQNYLTLEKFNENRQGQIEYIAVSGVWLRRIGNKVEVLIERLVNGERKWFVAITEDAGTSFSHIAEARGAYNWKDLE